MSRLLVGLPQLRGKLATYAERYDVVEVRPVDTPLPKASKLAKWRTEVPPGFAFSVVLPSVVASLAGGAGHEAALAEALEAARNLQANALLLATPASVRPTQKNRDRILALADALPRDAHPVAWHAGGMWEVEDVMSTASRAGLHPVFDASQDPLPPGPFVYTRIRALGHATRLGADRIELVAHQVAGRREAIVIVEGDQGREVRTALRSALERLDDQRPVAMVFKPRALDGGDEEQE